MDLDHIPDDPFECRVQYLEEGFITIARLTVDFIKGEYLRKAELYDCLDFMTYSLSNTCRSDLETFRRIWTFPTNEAIDELNEFFFRLLQAAYKSAFDHLRRALELIIIGSYFSMKEIKAEEAVKWLRSEKGTPNFSRAIDALLKDPRVNALESNCKWATNLKELYWFLCDVIHTRGREFSLDTLQPSYFSLNGIRSTQLSKVSLALLLDKYIQTLQNICTCVAITNPILLIGLPLFEKFGFDPPLSGFFEYSQSSQLRRLLIPETIPFFDNLILHDLEINSIANSIKQLPDLTEEELDKQEKEFRTFMNSMNEKEN